MFEKEWRESGLLLQIKNLKEKVAAYESGERYEKLREEHRKEQIQDPVQVLLYRILDFLPVYGKDHNMLFS